MLVFPLARLGHRAKFGKSVTRTPMFGMGFALPQRNIYVTNRGLSRRAGTARVPTRNNGDVHRAIHRH